MDEACAVGTGAAVDTGISAIERVEIFTSAVEAISIGAGYAYHGGFSTIENLAICNSTVAGTGTYGAGIGAGMGYGAEGALSSIENLTICNSTVTGSSDYGAGIGTGDGDYGVSRIGAMTICEATVAGSANNGAGIGTGLSHGGDGAFSRIENLTICNSTVAGSGTYGAGIGTGFAMSEETFSTIERVAICNSTVAGSASYGAGVGTGETLFWGISRVENVTIFRSTVLGRSDYGTGIGTTDAYLAVSRIESLTIFKSTVVGSATNGASIGVIRSEESMIDNVTMCDSNIDARGNAIDTDSGGLSFSNCTVWSDGITGSSILISSTLLFIASRAPLFGVSPSNVGPFDVVIAYHETTSEGSESLELCEGPFLQVGNLSVPENESTSFQFCIRKQTVGCEKSFERCFDNGTGRIRSVIVRSLAEGTYSFPGWISGHDGSFSAADGQIEFALELLNSSFLDVLVFGRAWPTCAFRASAFDILEGWKSVGFKKSAEGISRALTESGQFQNAHFFGTYHGTDNRNSAAKSLAFDLSRVERISTRCSESVGALRETGSDTTATLTFAWDSHFPSGDEANVAGSTAVWIGAGSSLAVVLLIVVIVLLLGCRPRLKRATVAMESDMETNIPADGEVSSMAVDPFLSEVNALSVDRKIPGELAHDCSEGALRSSPSNREADSSKKTTPSRTHFL
jgi:hypothetical protein